MTKKLKQFFIPNKENNFRPKFLESRGIVCAVLIIILLKIALVPFLAYFSKTDLFAYISRTAIIDMLNKDRRVAGLPLLKENPVLARSALLKAQDMLARGYFNHYSPDGKSPWYWFKEAGYKYAAAGENLGIGFVDSEEIYNAWKNSPSHRANLLSSHYKEVGIAVLKGNFQGKPVVVVVQHFGSPLSLSSVHDASNTPKQPSNNLVRKSIARKRESTEHMTIEKEKGIDTKTKGKRSLGETVISTKLSNYAVEQGAKKTSLRFKVFKFINIDYPQIIQAIMVVCFAFIFMLTVVNIFAAIKIQHKDLIAKSLGLSIILFIVILANKGILLKIIPHNLGIY